MYIICILYVYKKPKYAGFCSVFLFFWRPQRFLPQSSGFSWVLRSVLNRVLIPAQECRGKTVQNRTGIMDLQNKSNILVAKQ